jgi:DNA-binding CsgD family transcriptional regulator
MRNEESLVDAAALVGRSGERAALDRLLREIRDGASGSLVLRGDPGIGKSALLDYAAAGAAGFLVIRVTGVESEMEFAFAALQQACAPLLKHLDQLPAPQSDALRVAFGLSHGDPPDRFLVGLGVLGLAAEEAAAQPVLCIVDDAQWIDQTSLQALAVMARRIYGESVGMIFAARTDGVRGELAGFPELVLSGLTERDARAVLAGVVPQRLDLDAVMSAMLSGGRGGTSWQDVAVAAAAAPPLAAREQADDLLLEGLAAHATDGYQACLPPLREALRRLAEVGADVPSVDMVSVLWLACRVAINLWDDESFVTLAERMVAAARGTGTLLHLPPALSMAATASMLTGDLAAATASVEQLDAVCAVTATMRAAHGWLALTAWQGQAGRHAAEAATDQAHGDRATVLGTSAYTTALLCNGLGRYAEAADAASAVLERADDLGYTLWALPELAEAAARSGRPDLARQAVTTLERTTRLSGTDWALGIQARSRALISAGEQAEELYAEAVTRLGRTRVVPHLARAHLLYGEWLRRAKRKTDARAQLRSARELFTAMGADGFTQRTERELAASGERIRRRDVRPVTELTAQEAQIARLVADGRSNPEIATELFISPRTVEYHLRKIFGKLDITGRGQLASALAAR